MHTDNPSLIAVPGTAVAAAPSSELPIFHTAMFDGLFAFLPAEAVGAYVRTLAERGEALLNKLRALDPAIPIGRELGSEAHALAGSAGMFGFERLASLARHFEYAVETRAAGAFDLGQLLGTTIEISLLEMHNRIAARAA